MENDLTSNDILKSESVGYLKSKINLQQGTLVMTTNSITLEAHKTAVGGMGILGALLKKKVEKSNQIFNLKHDEIQSVTQGKQGVNKNVLEITDHLNNIHRIIVKNYQEWETALKSNK